jgi:hypothetical protein
LVFKYSAAALAAVSHQPLAISSEKGFQESSTALLLLQLYLRHPAAAAMVVGVGTKASSAPLL